MSAIFILAWFLSACFTVLIGVGVFTYVRRTWQLIRADSDGSAQERLLDGLDQVQSQLYAMSERLQRLEQRLEVAGGDASPELPPAIEDLSHDETERAQ